MPTLELDEGFEGSLAAYTVFGGASIDTGSELEHSGSLLCSGAGAIGITYNGTPASQARHVGRFTFKYPTGGFPSGASFVLYQVRTNGGTNFQIRVTTAGVMQGIITGGTAQNGPTLVEGTRYVVDLYANCAGNPHTLDWLVDGAAQTQCTSAKAASTIQSEKLGNTTSGVTANTVYLDSWAISRDSADYPIGFPPVLTMPSVANASAPTAPTIALVVNSLEVDEEFDGGFADWLVTGSPVLDTATPIQSGASARFTGHGFQWLKHVPVGSFGVEVFSFLYRHESHPTASATIYSADSAAGKGGILKVTPAGVLQAAVSGGGVGVDGPTLVPGTTYLIDGRFDCSAATFTLDWQVDGTDQTQATYDNAAASAITATRVGQVNGSPDFDFSIDALRISRVHDDYPLGQPPAAALPILPGLLDDAPTLHGPAITNVGNLVLAAPRIAATGHPNKPSISIALPPPPPNTYDGPRGVGVRTTSADITGIYNARPWADVVAAYVTYASLKPTAAGAYDWSGIELSLKHCIDNPGRMTAIRVEMGASCPAWIYAANSIGQCEPVHVYTGPSDATGDDIPLPWGAETRAHWQGILTSLATLLETAYNGRTYADVVAFVSVSNATTVGTEMTIGDAADPRNTAVWNTYGTQTERRVLYADAWFDGLTDVRTILPDARASVAEGPIWADHRQGAKDIALRASQTWPDALGRLMFGPTDMRVDKPGAESYAAWSQDASDALDYFASLGVTCWAQSAGDSWFGSGSFDIATVDAVKKSYLDEGCDRYRVVLMESNPQILGKYVLDSWAQNTLAPAIKALALPQTILAGQIANAAIPHRPLLVAAGADEVFAASIPGGAQLRGGLLALENLPSPDFIVPCYNESVTVSSPETLIVSSIGAFVYEVEL